jgi:serine/threonine protein kinase
VGFFTKLKQLFASKGKAYPGVPRINVSKRFELLGRTGQGSMSKVWRARDKQTGRTVCVKILDKIKTARFEARFPGLKRPTEGAVLMSLRHPNLVQTYEWGSTTDGEQYIIMELIDGMGLNFLIETQSPQLKKNRLDYLNQMAEGIEYIHQQRYLHRDICPRNVMVNREGVVKLIDFGLTVPYRPEFCRAGNRTGTPNYLAPELIKRIATDHRVDLFALGVTAYEVYTGDLPWEKSQSLQTLQSHLNSPGRDPREKCPDLDDSIAEFLMRAIERDPAARFQSATEFKEALSQLPAD